MVEQTTGLVLMESTRASIERMADEVARDMMDDPEFRRQLRDETGRAAKRIKRKLRGRQRRRAAAHPPRRAAMTASTRSK
jgi:hypothetical protein